MKPSVSIIIPVYNEKEHIEAAVLRVRKSLKYSYEILVVYDFAQDNTVPVIKKLIKTNRNLKLLLNKKRGLINAVKTGMKNAKGKTIVILSPDEADDPSTINKMYEKVLSGYDVVCASRYSKKGKRVNQTSIKMYLSKIAGSLTPIFLGIPTRDITNGFKMFKKEVVEAIKIESTGGWEFSMEITIKSHALGFKVTEVGTVSKSRKFGKSKFKLLKWLPQYIRWYIYGIGRNFKVLNFLSIVNTTRG